MRIPNALFSGTGTGKIILIMALGLCSAAPTNYAVGQNVDDEPAMQVFPDHYQIGQNAASLEQSIKDGRARFRTKFNKADGAGRPYATGDSKPTPRLAASNFGRIAGPDASACSSCHNEPTVGGSGDAVANVFVGAQFSDPPTLSTDPAVTNERNTITLFGSGLIEMLAAEMTADLSEIRSRGTIEARKSNAQITVPLRTKGVSFGSILIYPNGYIDYAELEGIDYDLVVKPFGVKGIIISLREFAVGALNHHHGIQATERFGWERTGLDDFDGDGVVDEFSLGQVTALTLFQAHLPPPKQQWSSKSEIVAQQKAGERLFGTMGCAGCHLSALELSSPIFSEPNHFNRPGALSSKYDPYSIRMNLSRYLDKVDDKYIVRAFTDLKRHDMCDDDIKFFCNEKRKQDNVGLELFMTMKLWDLATSGPYCHRGNCSTITEAIDGHGGEGRASRDVYVASPSSERRALISYLLTLGKGDELSPN